MNLRHFALPLVAAAAFVVPGVANAACAGAGLITRIAGGLPQDVTISRSGSTVAKPRVLEVVCTGDVISVRGAAVVTLSIDGVGAVKVDRSKPYTVGPRKGKPTATGNIYRAVGDQVMPDMKRLPWDARTKGEELPEPLHFSSPVEGVQTVSASRTSLLVRLIGPGPYKVDLLDSSGAAVKSAQSDTAEIVLSGLSLRPGDYRLVASNGGGERVEMKLRAENGVPAASADASELTDAELVAAMHALELAKSDPNRWSFEAQQIIHSAPANGLDRERVYQLIETYGF